MDEQLGDVSFLIDEMLAANVEPGNFLEGGIDASRVGAVGHSLGGATVLGATFHPDFGDARIGAVVGHAPLACVFTETFFDGGTAPMMIIGGTEDLVTGYLSNHLAPYGFANAEKYLVTLGGGTHFAFANDLLGDDALNPDEELACPVLLPPGSPRPVVVDYGLPPDYLGGVAAGIDPSGSACEALCPPPPAEFMTQTRQNGLSRAATAAMFEYVFRGDVSADRLISGGIDTENPDVSLLFER